MGSCQTTTFVVANIHDEFQIEARKELAESVGQVAVKSIEEAGKVPTSPNHRRI